MKKNDMKKEWFEEWFDSPYYHLLYKSRDDAEAKHSLDNLLIALDLPVGARVLDLACGKGRHSRYLADKGFCVTGVDISEKSVSHARDFEGDHLEFFQHDMRKPFMINYFDGILNMFTSFGYFKSDREHLLALQNICKGLRSGGLFLIDYFNSAWIETQLVESESKTIDDVTFHLTKHIKNGYVYKSVGFKYHGRDLSFTESVRLFELSDFSTLFAACNLKIIKSYGDYDLSAFDRQNSRRLIIVAQKTIPG
jgi:SAM-dependent methyltransferase